MESQTKKEFWERDRDTLKSLSTEIASCLNTERVSEIPKLFEIIDELLGSNLDPERLYYIIFLNDSQLFPTLFSVVSNIAGKSQFSTETKQYCVSDATATICINLLIRILRFCDGTWHGEAKTIIHPKIGAECIKQFYNSKIIDLCVSLLELKLDMHEKSEYAPSLPSSTVLACNTASNQENYPTAPYVPTFSSLSLRISCCFLLVHICRHVNGPMSILSSDTNIKMLMQCLAYCKDEIIRQLIACMFCEVLTDSPNIDVSTGRAKATKQEDTGSQLIASRTTSIASHSISEASVRSSFGHSSLLPILLLMSSSSVHSSMLSSLLLEPSPLVSLHLTNALTLLYQHCVREPECTVVCDDIVSEMCKTRGVIRITTKIRGWVGSWGLDGKRSQGLWLRMAQKFCPKIFEETYDTILPPLPSIKAYIDFLTSFFALCSCVYPYGFSLTLKRSSQEPKSASSLDIDEVKPDQILDSPSSHDKQTKSQKLDMFTIFSEAMEAAETDLETEVEKYEERRLSIELKRAQLQETGNSINVELPEPLPELQENDLVEMTQKKYGEVFEMVLSRISQEAEEVQNGWGSTPDASDSKLLSSSSSHTRNISNLLDDMFRSFAIDHDGISLLLFLILCPSLSLSTSASLCLRVLLSAAPTSMGLYERLILGLVSTGETGAPRGETDTDNQEQQGMESEDSLKKETTAPLTSLEVHEGWEVICECLQISDEKIREREEAERERWRSSLISQRRVEREMERSDETDAMEAEWERTMLIEVEEQLASTFGAPIPLLSRSSSSDDSSSRYHGRSVIRGSRRSSSLGSSKPDSDRYSPHKSPSVSSLHCSRSFHLAVTLSMALSTSTKVSLFVIQQLSLLPLFSHAIVEHVLDALCLGWSIHSGLDGSKSWIYGVDTATQEPEDLSDQTILGRIFPPSSLPPFFACVISPFPGSASTFSFFSPSSSPAFSFSSSPLLSSNSPYLTTH
ncbi:hypothetical protein ADUPG1_008666, partial [Aduncisulcus paluster]